MLGNADIFSSMIQSTFDMAALSVEIAIGLIGVLAMWLVDTATGAIPEELYRVGELSIDPPALLFALAFWGLWRSAANLEGHVHAGAAMILEVLARQSREAQPPTLDAVRELLPGLGDLTPVSGCQSSTGTPTRRSRSG